MKKSSSVIPAALTAAVLATLNSSAFAQNQVWSGGTNNANPGVWNATAPTNWVFPGGHAATVPNATNVDAIFDSTAANKNLTLSAATSIRRMYLYGGNYTLNTSGQAFNLTGGVVNFSPNDLAFTGNVTAGTLTLAGSGTGAITFNGATTGTGNFTNYNEGAVNIKGAYTGATALRFNGGTTTLSDGGSFNQTGTIWIGRGEFGNYQTLEGILHDASNAALVLDNTGTNNPDRLAATAITFSQRALLELKGNSAGTTEDLGALALGGAAGVRIQVNAASASNAQLTFASLTNGQGLAQYLSNDTLGGASKVVFTNTANTDTNGVLRYSIVKDATTGTGANFAQYGANGVQALASYTTNDINASTNTAEVDLLANATLSAGNKSVSALRISGGSSTTLGNSSLLLAGAGGFILNTASDYEIIGGGTGVLSNTTTPSYVYLNSNTLTVSAGLTTNQNLYKSGAGRLDVAGTYTNSGATLFVDQKNEAADINNTAATNDDMRISGVIAGAGTFTKSGQGQLALTGSSDNSAFLGNGTNSFSLAAGTLVLAKDTADLQGKALGGRRLDFSGGSLAARGFAATIPNTVFLNTGNSQYSSILGDQNITFSGIVTGSAGGSQNYALFNNSTATVTFGGTLQAFSANNAAAVGSNILLGGSGKTVVSASLTNGGVDLTDGVTPFTNSATMVASLTKQGSGTLELSGTNTYTGATLVQGGSLRLSSAGALAGSNLSLREAEFAYGQNAILELGTGNPTFTRTLGTAAGQVQLGGNSAGFASVSGTSTVSLSGGAALTFGSGSFLANGGIFTLGSAGTAGTLDFQNAINLGGNTRTIRALNGTATIDGIVSGALTGTATGVGLIKDGAGGLSLTNNGNTYAGGTVVKNGTLFANNATGSATGSGTVTVASGAAIGGGGSIAGATTVSGSVRPGNSIGTLSIANNVTWNSGNAWIFELGVGSASIDDASLIFAGSNDLLNITNGGFSKGSGASGSFIFDFAGTGGDGVYKLVDWTTGTSFSAEDFTATNLAAGGFGTFTVDSSTSALYLTVTGAAVPEPTSLAALGLAGLLGLSRRRAR